MILYHGSYIEVVTPKIVKSESGRDFGQAFYLTPIKEHAEIWARKKVIFNDGGEPTVSVFLFDEDINDLKCKVFKEADLDWLDFIILQRSNANREHGYDLVEGKIADDSVGETVQFVCAGVMRREDALERLKYEKINYQLAFCTPKALNHLKFKESYKVK